MAMDKWVVNNYIVQMRNSVIQARVQTLNKLVREIRKLQNKKGSAQQKEKNRRKAERFKQEVFLIKKLEPNEVSKFALLVKEDPEDELKKDSISLEERSKMRIIAHRSVVQQVEIFRMKYPDWELKLPPLLVQLGLKNKYKNKSELHTRSPKHMAVAKKSVQNDEKENNVSEHYSNNSESESSENEIFLRSTVSSVNDDKKIKLKSNFSGDNKKKKTTNSLAEAHRIADLTESDGNSESSVEYEKKLNIRKNILSDDDDDDDDDDVEQNTKTDSVVEICRFGNSECYTDHETKSNPRTNIPSKHNEKKKQVNSIAEIRRFADLMKSEGDFESSTEHEKKLNSRINIFCNDVKKKEKNGSAEVHRFDDLAGSGGSSEDTEDPKLEYEKLNPTNAAVDPFFLTGDDSGASDEFDSDPEERNQIRIPQNRNRGYNFYNDNKNQTSKRSDRPTSERHALSGDDQKVPSLNRKQRRMLERAKAEKNGVSVSALIKELFPKHVGSSVKTKFGGFSGQEDVKKENSVEKQESLHPSWEAKRKMKEQLILPFQGKKIKFDE